MSRTLLVGTLLLLCTALTGCSQTKSASVVAKPTIPTTEATCLARGGSWTSLGLPMPGKPKTCDLKATDAGKACTDSNQCEGACLATAEAVSGNSATGSCSDYLANFGNVLLVNDGVVEQINVECSMSASGR
jgi:hypothetical protein